MSASIGGTEQSQAQLKKMEAFKRKPERMKRSCVRLLTMISKRTEETAQSSSVAMKNGPRLVRPVGIFFIFISFETSTYRSSKTRERQVVGCIGTWLSGFVWAGLPLLAWSLDMEGPWWWYTCAKWWWCIYDIYYSYVRMKIVYEKSSDNNNVSE